MKLDLSDGGKHVRTRDGRLVRILMTDGGSSQPVIGAVLNGEVWCPHRWSPDGSFYNPAHTHGCDLIPYAPTEQWLIEVPAGQTPIVLLPNSEEVHFSRIPTEVRGSGCAAGPFVTCAGCKTVQPVKVKV